MDVGLLCLGAPERRLVSGGSRDAVARESRLLAALGEAGRTAIAGGSPYPEEDHLATTPALARVHVHTLMEADVRCVVLDVSEGALAADALACVRYLERELSSPCRLVVVADPGARPSPLPALLSVSAALRRNGFFHDVLVGAPADEDFVGRLLERVSFAMDRHAARPRVLETVHRLKKQRLLCFGPAGSRLTGESLDADLFLRAFGIGVLSLRRDVIDRKAREIALAGSGAEGSPDPRLRAAALHLAVGGGGGEDARELPFHYAVTDLMREHGGTLAVVSEDADEGPHARALRWLAAEEGPDGRPKDALPVAPDGDFLAAASMLCCGLLTGRSAGYVRIAHWLGDEALALDLEAHPCLEGSGTPAPGQKVTLARWAIVRGRPELHVAEAAVVPASRPGRMLACSLPAAAFTRSWPAPSAALAQGSHAAALVDLARSLDAGVCMSGSPRT